MKALILLALLMCSGCAVSRLDKTAEDEMRKVTETPYEYGAGKRP